MIMSKSAITHQSHGYQTCQRFMRVIFNRLYEFLYTIAAFCDLSRAFDTISHDILLYKLNGYEICGNALKE